MNDLSTALNISAGSGEIVWLNSDSTLTTMSFDDLLSEIQFVKLKGKKGTKKKGKRSDKKLMKAVLKALTKLVNKK